MFLIRSLLLLAILLLTTFTANASDNKISNCEDFQEDCGFYACIEARVRCGRGGYPIAYGKKYCNKFEKNINKFSVNGQRFVVETKSCLIDKLVSYKNDISCSSLRRQAFEDHLPCYYKSGFCELSSSDKNVVISLVLTSIWRPSTISAGFKLLNYCRQNNQ